MHKGASLNILLLFPHFNTLEQASSLRSWQIGRFLAKQGHNVTVFAPGVDLSSGELFPEVRGKLYAEYQEGSLLLIRVYSLPQFRRSAKRRLFFEAIYAILTFLRSLTIRPLDIVVVAYPPAVMPIFGYLVAKMRRLPLIFEIRDLMADELAATGYVKSSFILRMARGVEQFVVRHSDHIISVSNGIKRFLVSRNVSAAKISVVTNGYEPEVFQAAEYTWNPRDEFGWGDRFVVVYAGALTNAYDIPTLLRCAERLKQYEGILFAIIGEGDRKSTYKEYCATHHLTNCQFIDYQPRRKMPVILSAANVGVHLFPDDPLWAYVLGNKPFDYLGSGLPMVYAGRGDTAQLIEDAKAGYVVQPEDDESLAKVILQLKKNPVKAKTMGERGRDFVVSNYHRAELLGDFEKVLRRVVANEPEPLSGAETR